MYDYLLRTVPTKYKKKSVFFNSNKYVKYILITKYLTNKVSKKKIFCTAYYYQKMSKILKMMFIDWKSYGKINMSFKQ